MEATVCDLDQARQAEEQMLGELAKYGYSEQAVFAVRLSVEEALTNAVKHGHKLDPNKCVEFVYEVNQDQISICITDQGPGFQPKEVPDPTADENLEKASGRGLMLMRAYMDEVSYNETGNQVRMMKRNC